MESEVPLDLIEVIFCRLPVKSLLRFRVVCRQWLSLIKDPKFIKRRQRSSQPHLAVVHNSKLFSFDLSTFHLTIEPIYQRRDIFLVNCCNGLLCLSTWDWDKRNTMIMLWNVATKQRKVLPPVPEKYASSSTSIGFGYDPCNDDYKVVRFYYPKMKKSHQYRAVFYSLRSNSWGSKNKHYNYNIFRECEVLEPFQGVYVDGALNWRARRNKADIDDGALNWRARRNKADILISLNFNTRKARSPRLPFYAPNFNFGVTCFDVLEGNLCVGFQKDTLNWSTDIWVMKEYGNVESWYSY